MSVYQVVGGIRTNNSEPNGAVLEAGYLAVVEADLAIVAIEQTRTAGCCERFLAEFVSDIRHPGYDGLKEDWP